MRRSLEPTRVNQLADFVTEAFVVWVVPATSTTIRATSLQSAGFCSLAVLELRAEIAQLKNGSAERTIKAAP